MLDLIPPLQVPDGKPQVSGLSPGVLEPMLSPWKHLNVVAFMVGELLGTPEALRFIGSPTIIRKPWMARAFSVTSEARKQKQYLAESSRLLVVGRLEVVDGHSTILETWASVVVGHLRNLETKR